MPKKVFMKLYCYIDETGQDNFGRLFIVAVVITGKKREDLRYLLRHIETTSEKGRHKWAVATRG